MAAPLARRDVTAIPLGRSLPIASSNQPGRRSGADPEPCGSSSSLFGLAPGGACHAALRCRTRGALLPHLFTLTGAEFPPCRRFDLCGAFPGVAPAGRYPAPFLRGARTFLSLAGAAVRSTGAGFQVRTGGGGVKARPPARCEASLAPAWARTEPFAQASRFRATYRRISPPDDFAPLAHSRGGSP